MAPGSARRWRHRSPACCSWRTAIGTAMPFHAARARSGPRGDDGDLHTRIKRPVLPCGRPPDLFPRRPVPSEGEGRPRRTGRPPSRTASAEESNRDRNPGRQQQSVPHQGRRRAPGACVIAVGAERIISCRRSETLITAESWHCHDPLKRAKASRRGDATAASASRSAVPAIPGREPRGVVHGAWETGQRTGARPENPFFAELDAVAEQGTVPQVPRMSWCARKRRSPPQNAMNRERSLAPPSCHLRRDALLKEWKLHEQKCRTCRGRRRNP